MDTLIQMGSIVGSVLLSLGGFEFIKWIVTRKQGKRVEEASADDSEFSHSTLLDIPDLPFP